MSRLAGIATVCGAAVCGGAACATPPAAAERPLGRSMARAARGLSAIVRGDARRLGRATQTGAVLSRRCCQTRVLRVFYRSPPYKYLPWHGAYELKLRTTRNFLGAVSISYFPTPAVWSYGSAPQREGPTYSFTITAPRRHSGWSFSVMDSFLGCAESPAPAGPCEGSSQAIGFDEAEGDRREFGRLFRQALVVAQKAERHEPISGEDLFPEPPRGA